MFIIYWKQKLYLHICTENPFELILQIKHKLIRKNRGYPSTGTRNVSECTGNKVYPKAQYYTTEFAKKMTEK